MIDKSQLEKISAATMFISFDLVNCTLYKATYKGEWANGVNKILEYAIQVFTNSKIEGYRFWKILGDEIVYTINIRYMNQIDDVLREVYETVVDMNHKIKSGEIGDATTASVLAVKATMWIADISPANFRADNFYAEYEIDKNQLQAEYLGTDIDTGFRIAQFTSENRVVISFELAALFLKQEELKQDFYRIHFVGYRQLKGLWNSNPYPIFMYHGDDVTSFKDSIQDTSNSKALILKEYIEDSPYRIVKQPYQTYEEQLLNELCNNKTLYREVDQLIQIIKAQNGAIPAIPLPRLVVHYSVLCYQIIDGKMFFFILNKDTTSNFGGAIMNHNLQYLHTIETHYVANYGLEIEIVKDERYHDPIPFILTTFHLDDGTRGTLFLAEIHKNIHNHVLYEMSDIANQPFYDSTMSRHEILEKAINHLSSK